VGHTSQAYWNMIGPFGGATAAVMLQAALVHPERLGDPIALTVNFAGPIGEGDFGRGAAVAHQSLDPALASGTAPERRGDDHRQRRVCRASPNLEFGRGRDAAGARRRIAAGHERFRAGEVAGQL
jgi:hypothetical protein